MRFDYQREMSDAFRAALAPRGLVDDPGLNINLSDFPDMGVSGPLDWLLSRNPAPTAIFMPDFGVAVGLHPTMKHASDPRLRAMSVLSSGFENPANIGHDFACINLGLAEVGSAGAALLQRWVASPAHDWTAADSVKVSPSLFPTPASASPPLGP
jgi:hypothetical protein